MRVLLMVLLLLLPGLAQDAEDQAWAQKIPIGPMVGGAHAVALPNVVPDKRASTLFPQPTVFQKGTLYVWFSSMPVQAADHPGEPLGERRSATAWQFLPNGRFFYDGVSYTAGTSTPARVQAWGRYTLGGGDTLQFETDGGESGSMELKYGRRNLIWGETTYGEVNWEKEALRRQQNQ